MNDASFLKEKLKPSPWGIVSIITFVLAVLWFIRLILPIELFQEDVEVLILLLCFFVFPVLGLISAIIGKRATKLDTRTAIVGFRLNLCWLLVLIWVLFFIWADQSGVQFSEY